MSHSCVVSSAALSAMLFASPLVLAAQPEPGAAPAEAALETSGPRPVSPPVQTDDSGREVRPDGPDDAAKLTNVPRSDRPDPSWTLSFEPVAWWASPSGKIRLPGQTSGGDQVRVERLNLDSPQLSPGGEIHINADRWRFTFSAADNSVDASSFADSTIRLGDMVIAPAETYRSSIDLFFAELTAGFRIYRREFALEPSQEILPALLSLHLIAGAQLVDVDIEVQRTLGGRAGAEETFIHPIGGVRADVELYRDFTIDVLLTAGGLDSSTSLDIVAGFQWRPHENLGVQIGWRQILYTVEEGEGTGLFEYEGGVAGLYGGVVIRF